MSYILDALRRSQAERDRGQVPGLNAQTVPDDAPAAASRGTRLLWAGLGLAVLLIAALTALLLWRAPGAPPPGVAVAPATSPSPAAVTVAPAPAPAPPPLPQVVSVPPAATPLPAPASTVAAAPVAPVALGPAGAKPVPAPAQAPTAALPAASPPAAASPRTVAWETLSPDQRQAIGPLVMGGSIWSEAAASRFVIVNGQVVREGEAAAPGVTLERIGPKSVFLRWRELRIEVGV